MSANLGALSSVADIDLTLSFDSAGTGAFSMNGQTREFDWKAEDDTTVKLAFDKTSDGNTTTDSLDVTYHPELDAISMVVKDRHISGTVTFTSDGTLGDQPAVDMSKAKAVTSIDQIAGTWKLSGILSEGILMTGNADALTEMSPDIEKKIVIEGDGKIKFGSETYTIDIGDEGAVMEESAFALAIFKLYNDSIIMDFNELTDAELYIIYDK